MTLPSTYQEVEYIQANGTQYINTGYIPSNNTKIKCEIGSWNTSIGRYETMYGARKQYSTSNSQGFYLDYDNNGSGGHNYGFGKDYASASLFTFQDGGIHIIEQSSNGLYQDGILKKAFDAMTFTSPVNMCIYALNDNGTIKEYGGFKLYFFKIWDSGTLVRDFVPCYRKSDNVIGLYDLVNNVFYTNAGTGTFTKGPTPGESGPIKKFLLGTSLIRPTSVTPSVIEETYTVAAPGTSGGTPFGKPGYKVIRLITEHEAYTTNSGRGVAGIHIYGGSSQIYNIHNQYFLGSSYTYGYPATDGGPYGATRIRQDTTALDGVRANSSATSGQRSATRMIFTEDSLEYHIGQTYGNWVQEGTITFSAATKTAIQSLFSDQDIFASANWWNNINPYTFKQITVTYQSI